MVENLFYKVFLCFGIWIVEALLKECLNFVFQRGKMCLLSGTNSNGTREKGMPKGVY